MAKHDQDREKVTAIEARQAEPRGHVRNILFISLALAVLVGIYFWVAN